MSDPYVGEIRMFAGNFPPVGWQFCDGQLMDIEDHETLYVLIGTRYGGDGQQTFALPDLRGRMPMHAGSGFVAGQAAGDEQVTLTPDQLPAHAHSLTASGADGTTGSPANAVPAHAPGGTTRYSTGTQTAPMAAGTVGSVGGSQPHDNMSPYLAVHFIIALEGIFPDQG